MRVELERRKERPPSGDQDLPSCGATRARPMTQWTARPRCRLRVLLACRMLMPLRASRSIGLRAGRDEDLRHARRAPNQTVSRPVSAPWDGHESGGRSGRWCAGASVRAARGSSRRPQARAPGAAEAGASCLHAKGSLQTCISSRGANTAPVLARSLILELIHEMPGRSRLY